MRNDHVSDDRSMLHLTPDEFERAKRRAHALRNEAMRGFLSRLGGLLIGAFGLPKGVAVSEGARRGNAHPVSC
jgi:hypothetical protein